MAMPTNTPSLTETQQGGASCSQPDASLGLIELEHAYLQVARECELEVGMSPEDSSAFWLRWDGALEAIATTPADTPAEIAAKARAYRAEKDTVHGDALLDSLCEDLERLAAA